MRSSEARGFGSRSTPRPDHAREIEARLTDIRRVCSTLGLTEGYKPGFQANGGLTIRCPSSSHNDSTPSCSVRIGDDSTLAVCCHGCDFRGDVFDLVAVAYGLDSRRDFPEVLEHTADLCGYDLDAPNDRPRIGPPPRPGLISKPRSLLGKDAFERVARELLSLSPLEGSVGVGLTFRHVLEEARADGWGELPVNVVQTGEEASRASSARFPTKDLAATEALAALSTFRETELSWIVRAGAFTWPEHRLLIPWRRPDGSVWGLQRRYAPRYSDETPPKGTPRYLWPLTEIYDPPERFAYGMHVPELLSAEEVWLCEGAVDVLALRVLHRTGQLSDGVHVPLVGLGLPGVSSWAAYRASVLPLVSGRRVVVAFDADKAGRAAVDAIAADAYRAGATKVLDMQPTEGKDWAECLALDWPTRRTR